MATLAELTRCGGPFRRPHERHPLNPDQNGERVEYKADNEMAGYGGADAEIAEASGAAPRVLHFTTTSKGT